MLVRKLKGKEPQLYTTILLKKWEVRSCGLKSEDLYILHVLSVATAFHLYRV
jgi:hypothetical protein